MPGRNNHIILRQVFDLSLPSGRDAFALQQEIGRIIREKLAPAMEALFDRFATPGELIQIERLEIDIGQLQLPQSGDAFVMATISALEEKLLSRINYGNGEIKRMPAASSHFNQWLFFLEKGHLPWNAIISQEEEFHRDILEQVSSNPVALDQLQHLLLKSPPALSRLVNQHPETFLAKLLAVITKQPQNEIPGYREEAWKLLQAVTISQKGKDDSLEKHIFYRTFWEWTIQRAFIQQQASRETDPFAISFLQYWINNQSQTFRKGESSLKDALVETLKARKVSFPFLINMIEKIEGLAFSQSPPIHNDSDNMESGMPLKEQEVIEKLNEQLLNKMQKEKLHPDQQGGRTGPEEKSGKISDYRESDEEQFIKKDADTSSEKIEHPVELKGTEPGDNKIATAENDLKDILALKDHKTSPLFKNEEEDKKSDREIKESDFPEGSTWYVNHAGIVLLHTFLKPYFKNCKLLDNDDFVSESARHRAVHLLQYLATGEIGLPEYDLVLPKFLCGVPFGEPIIREIILTEEEKSESLDLLNSAIKHWGKLGKSSPEGLREGFLQRDGKLEKRRQGWYLTVDQKSIDILLDFLPWNLRIVKLPWMPEMLRVEWG